MKRIVLFTAILVLPVISRSQSTEELKTTCRILATATNDAIRKNERHLVITFCNTFEGMATKYAMPNEFKIFFTNVKRNHAAAAGTMIFSLNNAPQDPPVILPGEGFTHHQLQLISEMKRENLLQPDKIAKMKFFLKLKDGTVDTDYFQSDQARVSWLDSLKFNINLLNIHKLDDLPNDTNLNDIPVRSFNDLKAKDH
jgi:hypothetical protein